MTDTLKSIKADDPLTFIDKARAAIGEGDALGVTTFDLKKTVIKLDKNKKVVSVAINPTIKVVRATWGGPSGENQTGLKDIEAWIKQHEQKHVKIIETEVAKAKKDFQKDAVGKTEAEVQSMLSDLADTIQGLSNDLDGKEGLLDVTKGSGGKWSLKDGPA